MDFSRKYFELLTNEYKGINLTRINEFNEFNDKQIVDSVRPYESSQIFKSLINKCGLMVDIGFGGGFPILPMANLLPDINFVGVETRNKKVKVVGEIASILGLKNVHLVHSRIENFYLDKDCVCTLKAVGKVNDFLSRISTDREISVFFYKGPNFYDIEKEEIQKTKQDWEIIEEEEIFVPGTEKRYLIGFKNKNVLRRTKDVKQLVKLSSIF
jgi:16S rRNA (guanine527-N7)-methyltransferase